MEKPAGNLVLLNRCPMGEREVRPRHLDQSESADRCGRSTARRLRRQFAATALLALIGLIATDASAQQQRFTVYMPTTTVNEGDSAQTIRVRVTDNRLNRGYTLNGTLAVGKGGDGATEGTDYETVADVSFSMTSNETTKWVEFTLTPKQDTAVEGNESITVTVSATGYSDAERTMTLTDDEISLSTDVKVAFENDADTVVTVTATAASTSGSARTVTIQVGKSTDSATEGTDYATVADFDITIAANASSGTGTFTLALIDDTTSESSAADESISISGSISGGVTALGTSIKIYDNDIALSVNPSSVSEEGSPVSVTVTASGGVFFRSRTIRVSVGGGSTADVDYKAVDDFSITIAANVRSATGTFTLTPIDDGITEDWDYVGIGGSSPGASVSGTRITLTENDRDPDFLVQANVSSATENGGAKTVTVTVVDNRDENIGNINVDIGVGRSTDSATEGTDYATVSDFNIRGQYNQTSASGTFTLTPTNDSSPEGTERIAVYSTDQSIYKYRDAFINLTDDDGGTITLSASPSSVGEGASATTVTVTATADKAQSAARTVKVSLGGSGSATYGEDFSTGNSYSFDITIAQNASSGTGTFTLTPTQDTLVEGNETVGISGRSDGFSITGTSVTLSDDDAAPAVNLSVSPTSLGEGDSGTKVTVTAAFSNTNTYESDKTVAVSVGGTGTATSGTDYTAVSNFNITISKGKTSGTGSFTLTPTNDTTVEDHETIGVAGTSTGLTVNGATLTLNDNDNDAVTLSADVSSVAEDGSATTVTVTATAETSLKRSRTVTVAVGGSGDGATEGTDYTTVDDFTITIAADATTGTGTFTLTPTQDTSVEGDETVGITGSGTLLTVTGTSLKITDDDARTIALTANKTTVSEGAGATTVTITATANKAVTESTAVTVSVGDTGDGATSGTDYTAVDDFTITIAANATKGTGTFTLTPTDDTTYEGEESVSVTGTSSPHTVTGTSLAIGNNDGIGISLSVSPTSVVEGGGSTSVTVTATATKTALAAITLDVQVGKSTDSATEGTDYPTVNDFTLTIAKDSKTGTATFDVIPNADKKTSESNETISVDGSSSPHTVTGTTLTLTNATAANPITLSVSPSSLGEAAGETTVTVTARMQASFKGAGKVTVTVGSAGSAKSGTDYAAVSDIELSFSAESPMTATGTFKLTPTDDSLVENNETVWVDGSSAHGQVVGASVTINDNDGSAITLSADTASLGEGASGKTVTVTATATAASSSARTVTVSVGRNGDGAIEGTDYAEVSDFTISIAANATTATGTFTLTPTQDTLVEGSESLTISGGGTGLNVTGTSVSLADDDTAPAVHLSVSQTSVTEGASDPAPADGKSVTVTATFSPANTYDQDRTVAVAVGGSGTATAGTDYDAVSNFDVKINANATSGSGTFTLKSTDDSVYEGDETIGVAGTSTGLTVNSATLTLADNDSSAVTVNDASATEGSDLTFTVTLDTAVQGGLTVTPSFTDGTATEGTDFDENTAALTFDGTANETETFTVSSTQDIYFEGDETFTVGLAVSDAPSGITATDTGTGTITNDETAPAVNLSLDTTSIAEDADTKTVKVTATLSTSVRFPEDRKVTVTVGASDDTAVSGTDYAAVTDFDITISKGEASGTATFSLDPTDNSVDAADKSITVSGAATGLTVNPVSITLNDDDGTPSVNLAVDTTALAENAATKTVTVTASLSTSVVFPDDRTVTVKVGKSGDTAVSGTDYAAVTDFDITIKKGKGSATATFDLDPTDNSVDAPDKSLTVSGTSTGLTVNTATITLNDEDGTPNVNLTLDTTTLAEDAATKTVTVTATLSTKIVFPDDRTVTVKVGKSGDTAVSGTDYAAVSDFDITIDKGDSSGTATFSLDPTDNLVDAPDKSLTVSGTSTGLMVNTASLTLTDDDATPAVNLSLNPTTIAEGEKDPLILLGDYVTVTATATLSTSVVFPDDRTVTVTVGASGDSAVSGTDFTAVDDFDITVDAGSKTGTATFRMTVLTDQIVETAESVTVSGASTGLTVNSASLELTDRDTAPGVNLSLSPSTVAEDGGATTVTVTATLATSTVFATDRTVTASVGKSGDTAKSGTDYTAVTDFDVTIDAGQGSGTATFTLTPTDNNIDAADKEITVSGTSTGLTVSSAKLALTDDDATPSVDLSLSPGSVVENAGATSVTVTVALSGEIRFADDRTVTVSVGKSGDSAVSGADYAAVGDFDITIAKGKGGGEATFTLTPTQDSLIELVESITVSGASAGLTVGAAQLTILDAPMQGMIPTIQLSASPLSVSEDGGAKAVTVAARVSDSYVFAQDTTVTAKVGAGGDSAVSGNDYAAVADFDIAIAAGEGGGAAKFTLTPTVDSYIEGTESLTISGAAGGIAVKTAEVTITESAGTPTVDRVTFSVTTDPGEVPEDGGAQVIEVTAWIGGGGVFEHDREVIVDVDPGTAKPDEDYRAYGVQPITIPAGEEEGTATFTLDVIDDPVLEGDEYLEVEGRLRGVGRDIDRVYIVDDDEISVQVSDVRASEGEDLLFQVSLTNPAGTPVALDYETRDGSATAGADYAATSGVLTIPAGETSATVSVATIDDDLPELDERMTLALVAPPDGLLPGVRLDADGVGSGTIASDDTATLSVGPATATEGAELRFEVLLSAAAAEPVQVAYATADGTATAGADYAAASGIVTIAAGSTAATVAVATTDDEVPEPDERMTLAIAAPSEGLPPWASFARDSAEGVILNDDIATISVAPASAREGANLRFRVSVSKGALEPIRVAYATADGTATAGEDYAAASGVLTIPAGATAATIDVATTDDDSPELDETLTLTLAAPADGLPPWAGIGDATANGTIRNEDIVAISVAPASAEEGDNLGFQVSLSSVADKPVRVAYATADGTAAAGEDYAAASGVLAIPAGATSATVDVATADDESPEADETLTLTLAAPAGGLPPWARVDVGVAGGTILNDDIVAVSVAPASAQEGADLSFGVALSMAADAPVRIAYATADGSATAGEDYAAASGTATIPAGATAGTIVVATTVDDSPEPDETLTLSVSAPAGGLPPWARVDVGVAGGTILNDDIVAVSVAPASAQEGGDLAFEVSLSMAADDPVEIAYATADGTAAAGDDYAASSGVLTVPAGSLSATVAVSTVADALAEPDETLTLSISAPSGGLPPWARVDNATAGGTILNDDIATVSVSPASAREGEDLAFAVSLSTPAAGPVSLLYSTEDGTATLGDDYAAADGRLDIAAGSTAATLTVNTLRDGWVEGDETLSLALSAPAAGLPAAVELGAARAAGTIVDIDAGDVRIESARAAEGGRLRFEVTLSAPAAADTALSWSTADGTAKASERDYVAVSDGSLTIPAGERGGHVEVRSVADLFVEPDETFRVRLAARGELPANVAIAAGVATGTIGDDDGGTAARLGNIHEPILADLSLAMTESVVDAVSGRIEDAAWGPARQFDPGGAGMGGAFGLSPLGGFGMSMPGGMSAQSGIQLPSAGIFGVSAQGAFGAASGDLGLSPLAAMGMSPAELRGLSESGGATRAERLSARQKLGGMSFRYAFDDLDDRDDDAPRADIELWGRADLRPLGGSHDYAAGGSVAWDGDVLGVVVGADRRVRADLLAGVAVSRFDSEFDYVAQEGGEQFDGVYRASMTSLHPYANWIATPRLDLWAAGGFGEGQILFEEEKTFGSQRADSDWLIGAAGGEFLLRAAENLIPGGVTTLDLKADAFATRLEVEDNGELVESLGVHANRLRLALVGEYSRVADSGAELVPSLELAARRDGGDGETGAGVEIGAKLRYASPGGRLSADVRAHALAAFDGDKREWGVGGALQLAPGPGGRGWSLVLSPSYGPTAMGVRGMWQQHAARGAEGLGASGARFDGEAGYGFRTPGGPLTVLTGFSWHGTGAARQTVGALLHYRGADLRLDLERSESAEGPEHGVMLRAEKVIGGAPQYRAD